MCTCLFHIWYGPHGAPQKGPQILFSLLYEVISSEIVKVEKTYDWLLAMLQVNGWLLPVMVQWEAPLRRLPPHPAQKLPRSPPRLPLRRPPLRRAQRQTRKTTPPKPRGIWRWRRCICAACYLCLRSSTRAPCYLVSGQSWPSSQLVGTNHQYKFHHITATSAACKHCYFPELFHSGVAYLPRLASPPTSTEPYLLISYQPSGWRTYLPACSPTLEFEDYHTDIDTDWTFRNKSQ